MMIHAPFCSLVLLIATLDFGFVTTCFTMKHDPAIFSRYHMSPPPPVNNLVGPFAVLRGSGDICLYIGLV